MEPEKIRVVLDTNIIASAAISADGNPAKVFGLLLAGGIQNYTTEEIITEIEDVMERNFFRMHIDEEFRKFILENYRKNSIIIEPKFSEKIVEKDIKDDKFVNCALSAKADIISGDRHLLELKSYKGIKILTAREFVERLKSE